MNTNTNTSLSMLQEKVASTYRLIERADRPEVWICLRSQEAVQTDAADIAARLTAGESLPLAGVTVAVKDNIDVAGIATTAGAPRSLHVPSEHATVVSLLVNAGALIIGKTNMDQFATGLVGSRSPYGAVRAAWSPELISGGSSSGSAVAVALGLVDISLGTDTAGSGRVPAAFNGVIGVKPTLGLLSNRGVFPASPSYDTVTVFARTVNEAEAALSVLAQPDPEDPGSRRWPSNAPLSAPTVLRIGIPTDENLSSMDPEWRRSWDVATAPATPESWSVTRIDISFLLEAAQLLYGGALIAERAHSFGKQLLALGTDADPTVRAVVEPGAAKLAVDLVGDQQALREYRRRASLIWNDIDVLMTPTAPGQPTIAEVIAEPIRKNAWLGTFTNFVNLLDLAAIAVPLSPKERGHIGATLIGPAFSDIRLIDAAKRITGKTLSADREAMWLAGYYPLAVFGAHRSGHILNHELAGAGAVLLKQVKTEASYALYKLNTEPVKPGLVRVGEGGTTINGELWALPPQTFASFIADLPSPMTIGKVSLSDGTLVSGFLCEPHAVRIATDISSYGDWTQYLRSTQQFQE